MDKKFLEKHRYLIGYLDGVTSLASMTSENLTYDEFTIYLFPSEDPLGEFQKFFKLKEIPVKGEDLDCDLLTKLKEWIGDNDHDKKIAEDTAWLFHRKVGDPKRIYELENDEKIREKLEGSKGWGPYYNLIGLFFAEYEDYTIAFFDGDNE